MSYDIPDAPWIKYADNNGVPYSENDEPSHSYRVDFTENGKENREYFTDFDEAADFFRGCKADKLPCEFCELDSDGDFSDLIDCYEPDEEDE